MAAIGYRRRPFIVTAARMRVIAGLTVAAVLVACGSGGPPAPASACDQAMEAAAAVDEMRDTVADLYPVVRACPSIADFTAASARFPDALGGVDPRDNMPNLCAEPSLADAALCGEVNE